MPNRLYAQTKNTGKETSAFSTASDGRMFQSRPFVVQKQGEEKSREQPNWKTALMRAQRYGHNLCKMNNARLSAPQAVQQKAGIGHSVVSERLNSLQREQAKQTVEASEGKKDEKEADPVEVEDVVSPPTSQVQGMIQTQGEEENNHPMKKEGGTVQMAKGTPFSQKSRQAIIAANQKKNKGLITCENGKCGFQHQQSTYFSLDKRRVGDGSFHVDHIKPFSKGGMGTLSNGRVLCGTCNTSRGNRKKIGVTGMQKYRGLHGKKRVRVMKAKDYAARKKLWNNKKNRQPIMPKKEGS